MDPGAGLTGAALFPRFSDGEYERRHRAIKDAMAKEQLDAIVIAGIAPEVPYLINYLPFSPAWLVFPREGDATCFTHFYNHVPCAKEQAIIDDIRWYGPSPVKTVAEHLKERGLGGGK